MSRRRMSGAKSAEVDMAGEYAEGSSNKDLRPAGLRRGWFTYSKLLVSFVLIFAGYWIFWPKISLDSRRVSKFCTEPYEGRPLIQYVLMIDAGSSGSRIHVYRFNYCGAAPEIEDERFEQLQPGLSAYIDDPEAAAKSLDKLLDVALESVPKDMHHCTPVAVKATAGLRLHREKSDAILKAIHERLSKNYPFPLVPKDPVSIMDGKDEGVYAWITVNYLLGKLSPEADRLTSAATIDLGGGSVQIVFEPKFTGSKKLENGEHVYDLNFANNTHELYQHSYLGFGLNEARKAVKEKAIEVWLKNDVKDRIQVPFPCFSKDSAEQFTSKSGDTYSLVGTNPSQRECSELIKKIFYKGDKCVLKPCTFKGVYQPKLSETFKENDIYVFSFFYDRTYPFGLRESFTVEQIRGLGERICGGDLASFKDYPGAVAHLEEKYQRCLDVSYLHSLLEVGFELESSRKVISAKKIRGLETGWCLGAAIAVLDEKKYCPFK